MELDHRNDLKNKNSLIFKNVLFRLTKIKIFFADSSTRLDSTRFIQPILKSTKKDTTRSLFLLIFLKNANLKKDYRMSHAHNEIEFALKKSESWGEFTS
jgi:hypothetical protein